MTRLRSIVAGVALAATMAACGGQQTSTPNSSNSPASSGSSSASSTPTSSVVVASSAPATSPPASSPLTSSPPTSSGPATSPPASSTASSTPAVLPPSSNGASSNDPTSAPTSIGLPVVSASPAPPVPLGGQLTLTGTVEPGVERGCLILRDTATGRMVNLTSGDKDIVKVGAKVTVVGVIRKNVMSFCQQGSIFQVLRATAG